MASSWEEHTKQVPVLHASLALVKQGDTFLTDGHQRSAGDISGRINDCEPDRGVYCVGSANAGPPCWENLLDRCFSVCCWYNLVEIQSVFGLNGVVGAFFWCDVVRVVGLWIGGRSH